MARYRNPIVTYTDPKTGRQYGGSTSGQKIENAAPELKGGEFVSFSPPPQTSPTNSIVINETIQNQRFKYIPGQTIDFNTTDSPYADLHLSPVSASGRITILDSQPVDIHGVGIVYNNKIQIVIDQNTIGFRPGYTHSGNINDYINRIRTDALDSAQYAIAKAELHIDTKPDTPTITGNPVNSIISGTKKVIDPYFQAHSAIELPFASGVEAILNSPTAGFIPVVVPDLNVNELKKQIGTPIEDPQKYIDNPPELSKPPIGTTFNPTPKPKPSIQERFGLNIPRVLGDQGIASLPQPKFQESRPIAGQVSQREGDNPVFVRF